MRTNGSKRPTCFLGGQEWRRNIGACKRYMGLLASAQNKPGRRPIWLLAGQKLPPPGTVNFAPVTAIYANRNAITKFEFNTICCAVILLHLQAFSFFPLLQSAIQDIYFPLTRMFCFCFIIIFVEQSSF